MTGKHTGRRETTPVFLCQLEADPRDPSAIIETLTEERDSLRSRVSELEAENALFKAKESNTEALSRAYWEREMRQSSNV